MRAEITTPQEAAEVMVTALLDVFSDVDDDAVIPTRDLFAHIAAKWGIENPDVSGIEEEMTMREFRRRARFARGDLARVFGNEIKP